MTNLIIVIDSIRYHLSKTCLNFTCTIFTVYPGECKDVHVIKKRERQREKTPSQIVGERQPASQIMYCSYINDLNRCTLLCSACTYVDRRGFFILNYYFNILNRCIYIFLFVTPLVISSVKN